MHSLLQDLIVRLRLTPAQAQQLWQSYHDSPPPLLPWLRRGIAAAAALLLGAALVFGIAAHWLAQTRGFQLLVLEAAVLVPALLAALVAKTWRAALLLLATVALGGLLAFVGQTYQTGADAWQLFATWAALSLLWVVLAASDVLWALWCCIAAAALALWSGLGTGLDLVLGGGALALTWHALLWLPLWAVAAVLPHLPRCAPPHTHWSRRCAALLVFAAWTTYGLWALFEQRSYAHFALPVGLILLPCLHAWRSRPRDMVVLALGVLALNVLWLGLVVRWVGRNAWSDLGGLFLISLAILGSIALSVHGLLRLQRQTSTTMPAEDAP